ncbi:MAG TPA: hypothetical protein VMT58_05505 [Candidatus Binataceae bacterium]|nr:hypothetical protein [Candidatus Binataceae bacterium]
MRAIRIVAAGAAFAIGLNASGCTTILAGLYNDSSDQISKAVSYVKPSGIDTHAVRSIKTLKIERVAVMPVIEAPPEGSEPLSPGAEEAITAELYSRTAIAGGWTVIPEQDVVAAMQKLPLPTPANLDQVAIKVGHDVSADGVLYGSVLRYRERVGMDYSAAHPAAVTFQLKFLDTATGQVVWTASFSKEQTALTQNIFELANFVQRQGRWVRAHEIALEGVREAVNDLHGDLNLAENVKRFETGSYGQLKSGSQRYNTNTQGIY